MATAALLVLGTAFLADAGTFVWAVVDIVRRPEDQFPVGTKLGWTLGLLALLPVGSGLVMGPVYLLTVRRRAGPVRASGVPMAPPGPAGPPRRSGLAVASLVLGVLGLIPTFFPLCILALLLGKQAKTQIDQSQGQRTGRRLAATGMILGWVTVGAVVAVIVAIAVAGVPQGEGVSGPFSS